VRNYPWYREVQQRYKPEAVLLLGIHTPELAAENQIDNLKKKLSEAKLTHPVALDNDYANWKRWNNRYWPSIYLIDKKGVIRYRWEGELEWNKAEGGKQMHDKITELLQEK
jgi:hypothetical protein